jgi:cytochrome P450
MSSTTGLDIDILGEHAIRDPAGYFGVLREEHPVAWDTRRRSWILTRHEHITAALKDPRFSSDRIAPFMDAKLTGPDTDPLVRESFEVLSHWLVFNDAPVHTRLRRLIHKAFTPRAVKVMGESVGELCDKLLAEAPKDGVFDLVQAITYPLPAIVIAQMLGVPPEDRDRFHGWSEDVAAIVSAGLDDPNRYRRAAQGMHDLAAFCLALLRRYETEPADNLMTALIQARDEDESLSEAEVVATCTLLLFAGHETTANLIASSILALLQHPDELARLRAGEVETTSAVEELLRWDGPGKAVVRVLAEDVELDGCQMKAGQRVFMVLAAANRDPRVFAEPEVLRLDRENLNQHLAFGHGFHFCLGASLARLEAQIAIPKILKAYPDLALADEELRWQPVFLTRGLESLPVKASA